MFKLILKYSRFIFIILLAFSCQNNEINLENYSEIKDNFNQEEINDLEKIIKFFRHAICQDAHISEENSFECYQHFFEKTFRINMTSNVAKDSFSIIMEPIFNIISANTANEIWSNSIAINITTHDTLNLLNLNKDGKYLKFLGAYAKSNIKAKHYYESFHEIGEVSLQAIGDLIVNYKDYDVKDIRMELMVAIQNIMAFENYYRSFY